MGLAVGMVVHPLSLLVLRCVVCVASRRDPMAERGSPRPPLMEVLARRSASRETLCQLWTAVAGRDLSLVCCDTAAPPAASSKVYTSPTRLCAMRSLTRGASCRADT